MERGVLWFGLLALAAELGGGGEVVPNWHHELLASPTGFVEDPWEVMSAVGALGLDRNPIGQTFPVEVVLADCHGVYAHGHAYWAFHFLQVFRS